MLVQCAGNKDYVRHKKKKKKKERKRKKRLPRQFRYAQGLNPTAKPLLTANSCSILFHLKSQISKTIANNHIWTMWQGVLSVREFYDLN